MSKYIKGWLMPVIGVLFAFAMSHGGWWMWAPFVGAILFFIGADMLLPRDTSGPPKVEIQMLLNLPLYTILPLLCVLNFSVLWLLAPGDILGWGAFLQTHTGIDLFAAREATNHWGMWAGCIVSAGLLNAVGGTVTGHELTHRTASPFDLFMGRWMLAFTCDTSFAIEHVYGHHVRVATDADPATGRRGESFYKFTVRSTIVSYVHAFQMERARLQRLGKSIWNPIASPFLRGNLENLTIFVVAFLMAGWLGWSGLLGTAGLRGQAIPGDHQLLRALRSGARALRAGATPPFVELQPLGQHQCAVQPGSPLAPPR
jgi:hypothetical protein